MFHGGVSFRFVANVTRETETRTHLARVPADLGQEQVHTEGQVRARQLRLELLNLLAQHLGRERDAADHAQAARVGHGRRELGSRDVHCGGGRASVRARAPGVGRVGEEDSLPARKTARGTGGERARSASVRCDAAAGASDFFLPPGARAETHPGGECRAAP